jgi:hypothetical protein
MPNFKNKKLHNKKLIKHFQTLHKLLKILIILQWIIKKMKNLYLKLALKIILLKIKKKLSLKKSNLTKSPLKKSKMTSNHPTLSQKQNQKFNLKSFFLKLSIFLILTYKFHLENWSLAYLKFIDWI